MIYHKNSNSHVIHHFCCICFVAHYLILYHHQEIHFFFYDILKDESFILSTVQSHLNCSTHLTQQRITFLLCIAITHKTNCAASSSFLSTIFILKPHCL